IKVRLSGNFGGPSLPYMSYSGGYLTILPGRFMVSTYGINAATSLADTTFRFMPKPYYSLFFVGANGQYENLIVNDSLNALSPISGKAYIRYIDALPNSTNTNVTVTTTQGTTVVNEPASFKTVSKFVP